MATLSGPCMVFDFQKTPFFGLFIDSIGSFYFLGLEWYALPDLPWFYVADKGAYAYISLYLLLNKGRVELLLNKYS